MRRKVILITGAAGEIGQALIRGLAQESSHHLLTLDLQSLPEARRKGIGAAITLQPLQEARALGARFAVLYASRLGDSLPLRCC